MNLDKLLAWSASIVLGFAAVGKLDTLQMWIWKAQIQVVHESRSSALGSPRFFVSRAGSTRPHIVHRKFSGSP